MAGRNTIVGGLLLVSGIAAVVWYRNRDVVLSEPPSKLVHLEVESAPEISTVFVTLNTDKQVLATALNTLPATCTISGKATQSGALIRGTAGEIITGAARTVRDIFSGFRHKHKTTNPTTGSITVDYDGNLDRSPFSVAAEKDLLTVATDIAAKVKGYKGSVSDTVKARVGFQLGATIDIDTDWQLEPALKVAYHWKDQPVINVLGVRIGIANVSSDALDKMIVSVDTTLPSMLNDSLQLKTKASALWQSTAEPFRLNVPGLDNGRNTDLWLSVTPHELFIPSPTMNDGVLSIGLGLSADLSLSYGSKPESHMASPLPTPTKGEPSTPGVHVRLPLFVSYEEIESQWLPKLKGQDLVFNTSAGEVRLALLDSTIYTSGSGVAIGLQISAHIPGRLFDTKGWVYLVGVPQISSDDVVSMSALHFSRIIDNRVVSFVSTIGAPLIEKELSTLLQYDLHQRLLTLQQSASQHLSGPLKALLNPLPSAIPAYLADSTIFTEISAIRVTRLTGMDGGIGVMASLDGSVRARVNIDAKELRDALLKGMPKDASGNPICHVSND